MTEPLTIPPGSSGNHVADGADEEDSGGYDPEYDGDLALEQEEREWEREQNG